MKYLKVTITLGDVMQGQKRMQYPPPYNAKEADANKKGPLVYENGLRATGPTLELLLYASDSLADTYSAASADMEILTEAEADAWLAADPAIQQQSEETITDEQRLMSISLKERLGIELSEEDLRALDPDDVIGGITKVPKTAKGIFG
jgi:hypothetical protein